MLKRIFLLAALLFIFAAPASPAGAEANTAEAKTQEILERYRPDETVHQLLLVNHHDGSDADITLYEKIGGQWQKTMECAGFVGKNGIDKEREGDGKTPTGEFTFIGTFGICADPGAKLPYTPITADHYFCDDKRYYNQLINIKDKPHHCSGEHMIEYDVAYRYGLIIDFNRENIYGKGSAILIHCSTDEEYTAGCVAMPEENIIRLLRTVTPGGKIAIY
ncbi:MAG: L,D-transpeptidase family protein [Selenomonadaceae bacterium]|nr:L,D-transpeptidase family protein [Selenomonadaceae bacterium]